jgi:hypothetical protein
MHHDAQRPKFLRTPAPVIALLLCSLGLLAACSSGGSSTTLSSTALLATAAANLGTDTAFHFTMTEDHAGTPTGSDYDITQAQGDVAKPDKMSATATLNTAFGQINNVQVIVVSNHAWAKTPLTGDKWQSADEYANVGSFFTNANNGLAGMVKNGLQNVGAPTDGSANGVPCWKISSTVSSDYLSSLTNGQVQGGKQIPVTLCVGKSDGQLHEVLVPGKLTSYDTDQTTRTVILSNFNESVNITPPPGA